VTLGATGARHADIVVPVAHRPDGLAVRVTYGPLLSGPAPLILFSHGAGRIGADYAPLLDGWAAQGLVSLAPSHAEVTALPLWLARVRDMQALEAGLDRVEHGVTALRGCLTAKPLVVAGHSYGGHTAALLLGARPRIAGPELGALSSPLARAGLLLAPPGDGGPGQLVPDWAARAPYLALVWSGFVRDALIVVGTNDQSPMSIRDWRWHQDAYCLSPAQGKRLLVLPEAGHYLGGIAASGGDVSPSTLALVIRLTSGYAAGEERKQSFFEKKDQKTFVDGCFGTR
jgi:hypothetical protein